MLHYYVIRGATQGEQHAHKGTNTRAHARQTNCLRRPCHTCAQQLPLCLPLQYILSYLVSSSMGGCLPWRGNLLCPIRFLSAKGSSMLCFLATPTSHTARYAGDICSLVYTAGRYRGLCRRQKEKETCFNFQSSRAFFSAYSGWRFCTDRGSAAFCFTCNDPRAVLKKKIAKKKSETKNRPPPPPSVSHPRHNGSSLAPDAAFLTQHTYKRSNHNRNNKTSRQHASECHDDRAARRVCV